MLVGLVIGRYPLDRFSVHRGYIDALSALGVTPMIIPAGGSCGHAVAAELLDHCDALIATGGGDLEPATYGAEPAPDLMEIDPGRDAIDLWAVRDFQRRGRPVLGICRGAQAIAIAMEATLLQDLPTVGIEGHWDEARQYQPVHGIVVDPDTAAADALAGATEVNSIHHQAIADPGPMLRATAWSPDGVIEAVEGPGLLGLQWHPERLLQHDPRHLAPFEWLVKQ
jgi:putative glutamine amidotransferase